MYGKLNKLLKQLEDFLKQLNKNWHGSSGNLHDLDHHLENFIDQFQHFMQGKKKSGKLQQMLNEVEELLEKLHNHLQREDRTVHHLQHKLDNVLQHLDHLVHR
nr:Syn-SerB-2 protein [synthetic construct]